MNESNTVVEIKEHLDELGIEYNSKATKDELLSLIQENEEFESESEQSENTFKDYVVITNALHVRDENGNGIDVIRKGELFNGILVEDKVVNNKGNTVVAKFVEEVE